MEKEKLNEMSDNYEIFKAKVKKETVMDFWNNCYGRADFKNNIDNKEYNKFDEDAIRKLLIKRLDNKDLIVFLDEDGFEEKSANCWRWKWYE